jgi:TonB family protein
VSKHRDDISQIRKYLDGELDARAMHELERRAQDDPFLMDALEGYEANGAYQKKNLAKLNEQLQQRIAKKERRIIPFRAMAIAASVLLFLTIGSIVWVMNRSRQANTVALNNVKLPAPKNPVDTIPADVLKQNPEMAKLSSPAVKQKSYGLPTSQKQVRVAEYNPPVVVAGALGIKKSEKELGYSTSTNQSAEKSTPNPDINIDAPVGNAGAKVAEAEPRKDSSRADLAEAVVIGYAAQKKKTVTGSVSSVKAADIAANKDKATQYSNASSGAPAATALAGKVSGLQVDLSNTKTITGIVIAGDDHMPIPGASVIVPGTSLGTQTNADGKFKLTGVPDNASLTIAFIGYSTKKVAVNKKDSLNIELSASGAALGEVVVTGYGKTNNDAVFENAHPTKGWLALRKYLKENAIAIDGKPGKVRLSFTVNGNGELSDFKILKSLNKDADAKAIDLLQNGPDWTAVSDHKPQVVKVTVKFK